MTPLDDLKRLAEKINEPWDYYLETGMEGHGCLITYDEDEKGMRSFKEILFKRFYDDKPDFEIKKMYIAAANPAAILALIESHEQLQRKLNMACEALEEIAKPVDLDSSVLNRPLDNMTCALEALAEIRKKDDNG